MSCSLYITRAPFFDKSLDSPITSKEWLDLACQDETFIIEDETDFIRGTWKNPEDPNGYYSIDWFEGMIFSDVTSNAVIGKLLEIASKLGASVLDDAGQKYIDDSGYPAGWVAQPKN
jgi:hypothetical protein